MQQTLGHYDSRRNPDDLRFTKRTINLDFPGQLHCDNIYEVLNALENRKLIPRDLPSLRVIYHGGQLWTLDNKLLYIYRISPKVRRVSVVQVSNGQIFFDRFLAEYSMADIERMASAEFFPRVDNRDKSPMTELHQYRADRVPSSMVKILPEKKKMREKRSWEPKSLSPMRSFSSSRNVTSRISPGNTEAGTLALSVRSKRVHSGSKTSTGTSPSVGPKGAHLDSQTSRSRYASSTDSCGLSSTSEDTVDTKTRYPAVRSMTGHQRQSGDSLGNTSVKKENVSATARRRHFSFPSLSKRPATCHAYTKFSCSLFSSATQENRSEKNSSEEFTRLEPKSSKNAVFNYCLSMDRTLTAAFPEDHHFHSTFPVTVPDHFRENFSQSFAEKFRIDSGENVSQNFSSKVERGEDEADDDFELEAFMLPAFCYAPLTARLGDIKNCKEHEMSSSSSQKLSSDSQISSSPDRLDRSVSSCSSSTERPPKKPTQGGGGDPHRSGSEDGPQRPSPYLQRSGIGRSGSPLRKAPTSAGRAMKCHLSAEHEFDVSKQILLKYLKKAFFSVC